MRKKNSKLTRISMEMYKEIRAYQKEYYKNNNKLISIPEASRKISKIIRNTLRS